MFDYNSFLNEVIRANKEIYTYINTHLKLSDLEETKSIGFGGDKTLKIDLIAENIFIKYLSKFGDIYSEEAGWLCSGSNIKIIIDPIDGSSNFLSNLPYYGTSIAVKIDEKIVAGYVCNLVNAVLTYKDQGQIEKISILNLKKIQSFEVKNPSIAIFERSYAYTHLAKALNDKHIKYRSPGAVALSLCDAQNYLFVLFAGEIRQFDVTASIHINSNSLIYQNDEFLVITKSKKYFSLVKKIIHKSKNGNP